MSDNINNMDVILIGVYIEPGREVPDWARNLPRVPHIPSRNRGNGNGNNNGNGRNQRPQRQGEQWSDPEDEKQDYPDN